MSGRRSNTKLLHHNKEMIITTKEKRDNKRNLLHHHQQRSMSMQFRYINNLISNNNTEQLTPILRQHNLLNKFDEKSMMKTNHIGVFHSDKTRPIHPHVNLLSSFHPISIKLDLKLYYSTSYINTIQIRHKSPHPQSTTNQTTHSSTKYIPILFPVHKHFSKTSAIFRTHKTHFQFQIRVSSQNYNKSSEISLINRSLTKPELFSMVFVSFGTY